MGATSIQTRRARRAHGMVGQAALEMARTVKQRHSFDCADMNTEAVAKLKPYIVASVVEFLIFNKGNFALVDVC